MHRSLISLVVGLFALVVCDGCVARVRFVADTAPSQLVEVSSGVWVVYDYPEAVFYADDAYWWWYQGAWYKSRYADSGWVLVPAAEVPRVVVAIDHPDRYVRYHGDGARRDVPEAHVGGRYGRGRSDDAPGHDPDGPGRSEDAPGHADDRDHDRGRSDDAPGHDDDHDRGRSDEAPGHADDRGDDRGRSDEAPGHADEPGHGHDDDAHGHDDDRGRADEAPGHADDRGDEHHDDDDDDDDDHGHGHDDDDHGHDDDHGGGGGRGRGPGH